MSIEDRPVDQGDYVLVPPPKTLLCGNYGLKYIEADIRLNDRCCLFAIAPFTGVARIGIKEGTYLDELTRTPGLWRLLKIKQLAYLLNEGHQTKKAQIANRLNRPFEHNRLSHSLLAALLLGLIWRENKLDPKDEHYLWAIGLFHDLATPAGGDATKAIDPENLDEEKNLLLVLKRPETARHLRKLGLKPEVIARAVQGQGLWGKLLDIADKISYVALDTYFAGRHLFDLAQLIERNHSFASLFWTVKVDDDKVYFTNPFALLNFLEARIILITRIYGNPESRLFEVIFRRLLIERLYRQGRLTRDQLLEFDDDDLDHLLIREFGLSKYYFSFVSDFPIGDYRLFFFREPEELEKFRQTHPLPNDWLEVMEDSRHGFKVGGHFLVKIGREIKRLDQAFPQEVKRWQRQINALRTLRLYWVKITDQALLKKLKSQPT